MACFRGHAEIVEFLIQAKAKVDVAAENRSPLHMAVSRDHTPIIEMLLKDGANVDGKR